MRLGNGADFNQASFPNSLSPDLPTGFWFDPKRADWDFILELVVANGQLIRKWSEEKQQYAYRKADISEASQFPIRLMEIATACYLSMHLASGPSPSRMLKN
jgi:hypothetical protein